MADYPLDGSALAAGSEVWADTISVVDQSALDRANSEACQKEITIKELLLQAYGGVGKEASATQVIADGNIVQLGIMDAAYGPTAYNCTLPGDFDDITVTNGGIYEIHFETDTHNGEEGNTLFTIRDDTVAISNANATSHFGSTAAEFSMFKHISISAIAAIAAGSVLDVAVTCSSACTLTCKNTRFWVKRIGPSA